jgi:alkylation response protein AidB-like acyl-CoA dehydrogenase
MDESTDDLPALYRTAFDPEELSFRSEVAEFLRESKYSERQYFSGRAGPARQLYKELGARGWLSLCWPRDWNGTERPVSYEFLLWDTLAYFRAARPDIGPGMIARTIISNGTDSQKAHYLPTLASGALSCARLGPKRTKPIREEVAKLACRAAERAHQVFGAIGFAKESGIGQRSARIRQWVSLPPLP